MHNENPAFFFFFFLHQIDFLFIKFSAVFVISNILGHFNERIIVEWICKPICRQVKYFNRLHQHTGCKTPRLCTVHSWQAVYHKTGWCKSLTTVSGIEKKILWKSLEDSNTYKRQEIKPENAVCENVGGKRLRSENYANRWRQSRINGPQHFQALKELSKDTIGETAWPQ